MGTLLQPRLAVVLLLTVSSLGQSDARPMWKNWPVFEVGHPHSWQGPSSINVWREFDDDFGSPQQQRTSLVKTQPSSLTISLPNRCVELLHNQDQDAGIKNKEAAYKHRSNQRHSSQIANLDIPEGCYPEDITIETVFLSSAVVAQQCRHTKP